MAIVFILYLFIFIYKGGPRAKHACCRPAAPASVHAPHSSRWTACGITAPGPPCMRMRFSPSTWLPEHVGVPQQRCCLRAAGHVPRAAHAVTVRAALHACMYMCASACLSTLCPAPRPRTQTCTNTRVLHCTPPICKAGWAPTFWGPRARARGRHWGRPYLVRHFFIVYWRVQCTGVE